MSTSPRFKVYDSRGVYQASAKEGEIAAGIAGLIGEGATVRDGHSRIVWREGFEEVLAAESVDAATAVIYGRLR